MDLSARDGGPAPDAAMDLSALRKMEGGVEYGGVLNQTSNRGTATPGGGRSMN